MNDPASPRRKRILIRGAKILVAVLVVAAVADTLHNAWGQLGTYQWHFELPWLVGAGALYLAGLLLAGLFWHRVLHVLGQDAGLMETLRAYFIGHLGKYVPGKAMVVVLRAGLIRSHRVDTTVAAVSVFFETLTMMAVGAFLAVAVMAAAVRGQSSLFWSAVALMLAAGLPTLPPIFRRLARLAGVGRSDPTTAEKLARLDYRTLLLGWGTMVLVWAVLGLSLWATLRAMGIEGLDPIGQLPRYTASVSLAMVAGFLLLVLPGGLGVREAVLILLLVPYLVTLPDYQGPEAEAAAELTACVAAALLRVVWLASELILSAILYPLGRRA